MKYVFFIIFINLLFANDDHLNLFKKIKIKIQKKPNILAEKILKNKNPNEIEKKFVTKNSRLKFFSSTYKGKKEYHFVIHNPHLYSKKKNLNLFKKGKAPIGKDDKRIELHHFKQKNNGLLIETTHSFHKKYHKTLHPNKKSEINRGSFNKFRKKYYKHLYRKYR